MQILVVNAGSSSLKLSLLDDHDRLLHSTSVPAHHGQVDEKELAAEFDRAGHVDAVGHRVVHGGDELISPAVIDEEVRRQLTSLVDLAPLHQPKSLHALELVTRLLPGVPQVGCFDTAFHANIPESASTYALPLEWRTRWNLRRFGFHGLSHAYAAGRAAALCERPLAELRIITCHLGAGASLAAVLHGISVDTTMGFTPLEGLVMATRSGSVDPGLMLWLTDHAGLPTSELGDALEHRSGLLGLTGSSDIQEVLAAEKSGDAKATLGLAVYVHRLRAAIAAMAASMNGLDALVFTGGVGENSPIIRARAAEGLGFLGIALEPDRNATAPLDADIGPAGVPVRVFAVHAREDIEIARGVRQALGIGPPRTDGVSRMKSPR
jgi:acetate kinase